MRHQAGKALCILYVSKWLGGCSIDWTVPFAPLKVCIKYKDVLLKVSVHKCSEAL